MATSKETSTCFSLNDSNDNANSNFEEDNTKSKDRDDNFDSDFEEYHLYTKTSEEDSSWVRVLDRNLDSDFEDDFSAKTSDEENSWVKFLDHNVDADFQEDSTDYAFKEDLSMKSSSTSSMKYITPTPTFDIKDVFDLYDKSPHIQELDTRFSQILELQENKRYVEHSYVKPYKKLKLKDDKSLKDVIKEHALPFLPAKSLCRFRSVCKDWDERISHPFLAHQQTNSFKDISGLVLPSRRSCFVFFNGDAYGIPSPFFSFLPDDVSVKSTCNGLVCCQCSCQGNIYYVCNPVTKKWRKLPKPNLLHEPETVATLAFEPSALNFGPHYQLVCAVADNSSDSPAVYFEIYSSRTDTWRVSETVCYEADALTLSNDGFYMKDSVYWKTLSGAILTFHVKIEVYSIVQLPPNHGPHGALTHFHGELCYILPVILDGECIISVYGDINMSLKCVITLPQKMSGLYCQALPSLNDEVLIILLEEGVIAYRVRAEKVEILSNERIGGYQTVLPYINTLVEVATPSLELETDPY
ncbi:hypothetical protein ACOSP7_022894 [Xanthoceras sorbifolium]|uniref:PH domain-containing protein n=1 Tax=Xanthoceras sorbifolium TaxID=99658 RepID=A0ABQ8HPY5_9ROSI|nr:hypothetical protein JRO89_XS08G0157700 [Xanthoceras sorbifolium]